MNPKRYSRVDENPDMVKDNLTGAILNTNSNSLNSFKSKRMKEQLIFEHEKQIHMIQNDISDIKYLLKQLVKEEDDS
tara:strand:- start:368 stop:598 length:231 start_codon:yes stop_codon:yes gene_type:complete